MRKAALALSLTLIFASPAGAITYGEPDGNGHPNVGGLVAEWREPGQKELLCSGTLISSTVFLTAAHCTAFLESIGIAQVWVTFDPEFGPGAKLIEGTMHTNPAFTHRQSDPGDLAVVTFAKPVKKIAPAALPTEGLLGQMFADGTLQGQTFTAVGYGVNEPTFGGGPPTHADLEIRQHSVSSFRALNKAWLRLSQNQATGDGGTCSGDSGGPNFLGSGEAETNIVASITVSGDIMCLSSNDTGRLDTPAARAFLGGFVALP